MQSTLQGLSGVEVITDDILFYRCGRTDKECQKDMTQTYNVFYNKHETKTYSLIKEAQTLLMRSYLHETPLNLKEGLNPQIQQTTKQHLTCLHQTVRSQ